MTTKNENYIETSGNASPGWGRPQKQVVISTAGSNTPKSLRMKGKFTENPYRWDRVTRIYRQISWSDFTGPSFMHSGSFGSWPAFATVNPPTFTETTAKLLSNWRASSFNLGVTIGEGRETVELITSRLLDLARAAQALRKGNLGSALRHLSHVPKGGRRRAQAALSVNKLTDAWLELQYGWIPLIKDIENAAEFVKLDPKQNRVRARSRNKGDCTPYGAGIPQSRVRLFNNDRRLQQIVEVSYAPPLAERLGLTDPYSIVWELTTLSFVADWMASIGDYLATLHAVTTMPVTSCIQTYSSRKIANVDVLAGDSFFGRPILSGGTTSFIEVAGERTISPSLPLAWLASAQIPREITNEYEPPLKRLANASALAASQLRGLSARGNPFR